MQEILPPVIFLCPSGLQRIEGPKLDSVGLVSPHPDFSEAKRGSLNKGPFQLLRTFLQPSLIVQIHLFLFETEVP